MIMTPLRAWIIVLMFIILATIGGTLLAHKNDSQAREVYTICNNAHNETNGNSETQCGALQDQYNIKFLCDNNKCWTESK